MQWVTLRTLLTGRATMHLFAARVSMENGLALLTQSLRRWLGLRGRANRGTNSASRTEQQHGHPGEKREGKVVRRCQGQRPRTEWVSAQAIQEQQQGTGGGFNAQQRPARPPMDHHCEHQGVALLPPQVDALVRAQAVKELQHDVQEKQRVDHTRGEMPHCFPAAPRGRRC